MGADRIAKSVRPSPFGHISGVGWLLMLFPMLLTLTSTVVSAPPPERSARDLLEQGIMQESVHYDFQAALESYEKVLAHEQVGARTYSEAIFRLAECHEALVSPLSAWIRFHEVTKRKTVEDFHADALLSEISILIEIAEEETIYDPTDFHFLGDLFISLDGALQQTESDRALSLIAAASAPLETLLDEAETFSDHRLLKDVQSDLAKAAQWVRENQEAQALSHLRARPFFTAFLERGALADEDEVFGYALEQLDEVAIALNANNDILALKKWQAVKDYLAPLTPWPKRDDQDGTRRNYLELVNKLLTKLESHIVKSQLAEARRLVDTFTQEQATDGGMVHWHLDNTYHQEVGNPDALPHYAAATLHLEAALEAIDKEDLSTAEADLKKAEACMQRLKTLKANTSDEAPAADLLRFIRSMNQLIRDGEIDQLRRLLRD